MTLDFSQYTPQQTFLVQGDEALFETLCSEHPGSHALSVPRFTVDHAKHIAAFAREGSGESRMLVVHFSVFSPDAAQVLLKSLEEPALDTTVVFVTLYPYIVPLTIRSRVMMLSIESAEGIVQSYTKAQAAAFIKDELASESEDDASMRRAKAIRFFDELESMFRSTPVKIRAIYEGKHMLLRANLPTKYVAEYVVASVF